jgi:hydrogenase maturation protein HypF
VPVVRVQHHLAHVLACLLEHGGGPERVLGVAWDGTGYGSDGTVWGGEFIVVDRVARTARRVAKLRPFRLPGGEAAVREPRRSALGLLHELWDGDRERLQPLARELGFGDGETEVLCRAIELGLNTPVTTSAGRLFDGVAALLGLRMKCSFEGQAAMDVEFAAERSAADGSAWAMELAGNELDWRPMLAALLDERRRTGAAALAAQFHATLVAGIRAVARSVGIETVVLTGGCFQNARLVTGAETALRSAGFSVLRHRELPPGDGGIAAGQALGARWGITAVAVSPADDGARPGERS